MVNERKRDSELLDGRGEERALTERLGEGVLNGQDWRGVGSHSRRG